jgi:hypothetical protein
MVKNSPLFIQRFAYGLMAVLTVSLLLWWWLATRAVSPVSYERALELANWKIDQQEQKRNINRERWSRPVLMKSKKDVDGESWLFDFESDKCAYHISVSASGQAEVVGVGGCKVH